MDHHLTVPQKGKQELLNDSTIQLLKELKTRTQTDACTPKFMAALFAKAKKVHVKSTDKCLNEIYI